MGLGHVSAALARIDCSGAVHTLLWHDGELKAPDHGDPEAERGLAALGAEPCRCVELLDAWAQCASDPRVLVLGPRGPRVSAPDPRHHAQSMVPRVRRPLTSTSYARTSSTIRMSLTGGGGTPAEPPEDPLTDLLSVSGAIPHRLVSTVALSLSPRLGEPELAPLLKAALYGRVLTALSAWLGEPVALELEMIDAGHPAALTCDGETWTAQLPFSWLVDVWAPGLETVAGRFTLAANLDPLHGWNLVTIDQTMKVNAGKLEAR